MGLALDLGDDENSNDFKLDIDANAPGIDEDESWNLRVNPAYKIQKIYSVFHPKFDKRPEFTYFDMNIWQF